MKKLFSLFFALIASVGTLFAESGTCGDNLTWNLTNGVLTISGSGDMTNWAWWNNLYAPWYSYRENITSVIIGNSVTTIGNQAFYECSALTSATIGNSVTSIGEYAFYNCSGLTNVTISNSVTSIGEHAFNKCSGLTSVTIPNSVTSIGNSAFFGCSSLTSVTIPNSVTNIGDDVFRGCTSLTSPIYNNQIFFYMPTSYSGAYTIPNGIKLIAGEAFYGCSGITSVTIPNSVTSIGRWAFWGCTGLTNIKIPSSVTSIRDGAFRGCSGLTDIYVVTDNPNYSSTDGVLVSKDMTILILYPGGKSGVYTIPNSVTSIGNGAFENCYGLTNIEIPNSVASIGEYAFYECSGLTSVTIGNSVTSIGNGAFIRCTNLTSITIPNSVTSIGGYAFSGCSGLTDIICEAVIPPTCDGSDVFYDVNKSIPIYVPEASIEAYRNAYQWNLFTNYIALEPSPEIVTEEGEYTIQYLDNNSDELHSETVTLHVPVAPVIEGFSFLYWQPIAQDINSCIIIQAVYEADEQTAAPSVYANPTNPAQKLIRNGNVYILTDDHIYTLTGQEIK